MVRCGKPIVLGIKKTKKSKEKAKICLGDLCPRAGDDIQHNFIEIN
jgi:hypothetical protein